MLEKLRLIDWSAYSHAYGPADDVPEHIEMLMSDRPKFWVAALDTLSWTIYHQGSVFDCTAVAVPFLIELLDCPSVKCRGRIMELLAHIATAQGCLGPSESLWDEDAECWEEEDEASLDIDELERLAELEELFELEEVEELEDQLVWLLAARRAVWAGWRTYLELGADLDKRVRVCSPYLLGQLAMLPLEDMEDLEDSLECVCEIPRVMADRLETEPNDLVAASLLFGIEAWLPHAPQYAEVIRRHLKCPASGKASRLAAAICQSCLAGDAAEAESAAERMIEALEDIDACEAWFESPEPSIEVRHNPRALFIEDVLETCQELPDDADLGADEDFLLPWMEEGLLQEILDRFAIADVPTPSRLPGVLMDRLAGANRYTLENYSEAVRRFLMCDRMLTCESTREELTTQQIEVIRLLFHDASFWATNIRNVEHAFYAMGIPYCRATLARWLGHPAEVADKAEARLMLDQIVRAESQAWLTENGDEVAEELICRQMSTLILAHIGSDVFMPMLEQFPSLEVLEIGPYTTDSGLAQLPDLPLLDLTLDERITDAGMRQLLRFPALRSLNTFGTQLTDRGLEVVGQLRQLQSLHLSGQLTPAGLHALLPLKELRELSLPPMRLSLAVVPILQQLPTLTTLSLDAEHLDDELRRRIKLELPACQIWFSRTGC